MHIQTHMLDALKEDGHILLEIAFNGA